MNLFGFFLRKNADGQIKYAVSNAPEDTPFSQLCEAAIMRWPIEQCFQEAKSNLGMGHYEHRSWPAWHRHMLYVFLGPPFLTACSAQAKKKTTILTAAQAKRLIASVLPLNSLTPQGAIEIVQYHIKRNDIAYKSHRKNAIEQAQELGVNMSL